MIRMFTAKALVAVAAILQIEICFADERDILSAYKDVSDSLFGSEMIFSCGNTTYRAVSSTIGSPALYWQKGLDWVRLESAVFKEAGVEHSDLGISGGIPFSDIYIDIDIPLRRKVDSYRLFDDERQIRRYFRKIPGESFVRMKEEIEMVSAISNSRNIEKIVDYLEFDKDQYLEEQSIPPGLVMIGDEPFYRSKEHRVSMEIERARIIRSLEREISHIKNPIEVTTDPGGFKRTEYCRLVR